MNWFVIALINPVAHALANHFDKYLISRWTKDSPVGVLVIFSSLFAIVVLPILLIIEPGLLSNIPFSHALILTINGILLGGAIVLYLQALNDHEASYVIPFFQLVPVFGLLFGYFLLGETLTSNQFWALFLIVMGSFVLSLEFGGEKTRFRHKLVYLMFGSSFLYAINGVIFKYFTPNDGFVTSLFWNMVGMVLFGLVTLIVDRTHRKQFFHLLKTHHYKIMGMNILNEIIGLVGEIGLLFAVLLAPVALVQSIGGLQPLFVFLLGIVITLFFPKFGRESLLFHHMTQKIISIIIILLGLFLLEIK